MGGAGGAEVVRRRGYLLACLRHLCQERDREHRIDGAIGVDAAGDRAGAVVVLADTHVRKPSDVGERNRVCGGPIGHRPGLSDDRQVTVCQLECGDV